MAPTTDYGRLHLAAIEAERAERQAADVAARTAAALADLDVGDVVWSRTIRASDGTSARGGVVVDVGMADGRVAYVMVAGDGDLVVQSMRRGGRQMHAIATASLCRIDLDDIGEVVRRTDRSMHRAARRLLIGAAAGSQELFDDAELAAINAALDLVKASGVRR